MELTPLGTSAAFPTPSRACSCFLVSGVDAKLLLDLGPGAFSNLTVYARPESLDAIVITHLHQDHFLDMMPLYYYLRFEARPARRLPVYSPTGIRDKLGCILGERGGAQLEEIFDFRQIEESERIRIGDLTLSFAKVKHLEPTYGVAVETEDGRLAYTSDTGYIRSLVELARNAQLLVCEATIISPVEGLDHMTGAEAGRLASEASVARLLLTHIWPSIDHEIARAEAAKHFSGEVILAEDGEMVIV